MTEQRHRRHRAGRRLTITVAAVAGGSAAHGRHGDPAGRGDARRCRTASCRSRPRTAATGAVAAGQQADHSVLADAADRGSGALRRPRSSTPGSSLFRHFLSPAAYAAQGSARRRPRRPRVESWLKSAGFTGVGCRPGPRLRAGDRAGVDDRSGASGRAELLPGDQPGQRRQVPAARQRPAGLAAASVAGDVLGVTGLDNAAPTMTYVAAGRPGRPRGLAAGRPPIAFPCSRGTPALRATACRGMYGATRFPTVICGYTPQQLRRAYGYNRHNIGKGVTVALVEVGLTPDMFQTLQDYAKATHIQAPPPARYAELSLGKGSAVRRPLRHRGAAGRRGVLRHGAGGEPDRGRRRLVQQRLLRPPGPVRRGHVDPQRRGRPPAGPDRVELLGGLGDETDPVNMLHDRARLPGARGRRRASACCSRPATPRAWHPVERPVRHRGRRHHAGHRPRQGPRLFETGWSTGISADRQRQVDLPG